jgi:hypothetical protein
MRVVCINDSDRPNDIPISKWVVKGKEYTVIKISKMIMQGNILGVQLEEIDLSDCVPHLFFAATRFAEIEPSKEKKEEKIEELEEEFELA